MEFGCPVCNGFLSIGEICPSCMQVMEDEGRIEDFYTPYSPYEEQDDITLLQEGQNSCIHIFSCPDCGTVENVVIPFETL